MKTESDDVMLGRVCQMAAPVGGRVARTGAS